MHNQDLRGDSLQLQLTMQTTLWAALRVVLVRDTSSDVGAGWDAALPFLTV